MSHKRRSVIMCSGKMQALFPDIAQEWDHDRNTGTPDDYTSKSSVYA